MTDAEKLRWIAKRVVSPWWDSARNDLLHIAERLESMDANAPQWVEASAVGPDGVTYWAREKLNTRLPKDIDWDGHYKLKLQMAQRRAAHLANQRGTATVYCNPARGEWGLGEK